MTAADTAERVQRVAAPAEAAGERLDRVLASLLPGLSRSRLKALIEDGRVRSGAATISEPSYRVKPGQTFAVALPAPEPAAPRPERLPLAILYEDADLVVLDKPAGLVVHPAPGNPEGTLVNALLAHCGETLAGIGGVRRPGIVHRLDKDTSGLMVVAKTERAHAGLAAQFKDRAIARAYMALAWGVPTPRAGEIEGAIGRSPRNRKKMAVLARGGRPALTRYRVTRAFAEAASLIECRLATGRTHQIRVHLAWRGHPLIGDPLYGGRLTPARRRALPEALAEAVARFDRQALHACRLGFRHPSSGLALSFESAPPADMAALLAMFEKGWP